MSPLSKFFGQDPAIGEALKLYARIVEQARRPEFYGHAGVPDSLDGRFEMISLHMFLVLNRLKSAEPAISTESLGQALCNAMFADMDASLREMGAGDLGVGGRVKRMASGFMGRVAAYSAAIQAEGSELAQALRRNVYGTTEVEDATVLRLAIYVRAATATLARQDLEEIDPRVLEVACLKGG
jgi:cytochrome b pre-mRNA-processing protein 3